MTPVIPHPEFPVRSFHSFGILPAAGQSARMGQPKLLLPWGDACIIQHVLRIWLASRVERVFVVVRPGDATLQSLCHGEGAEVIIPDVAPPEMISSVQSALRFVDQNYAPTAHDVWLLAPADMPYLTTACIDQLLDAYDPQTPSLLVPQYHGKRGHPILLPWRLAGDVLQLESSENMRSLMTRRPLRTVETQEAGILRDVDTPGDYRKPGRHHSRG